MLRRIRAVDTVAIALPRTEVGHIPVPDIIRAFCQGDTQALMGILRVVEEAEIDPRSVRREQGKIHPSAIPGGTKRIGSTRIDVHPATLLVWVKNSVTPRRDNMNWVRVLPTALPSWVVF